MVCQKAEEKVEIDDMNVALQQPLPHFEFNPLSRCNGRYLGIRAKREYAPALLRGWSLRTHGTVHGADGHKQYSKAGWHGIPEGIAYMAKEVFSPLFASRARPGEAGHLALRRWWYAILQGKRTMLGIFKKQGTLKKVTRNV